MTIKYISMLRFDNIYAVYYRCNRTLYINTSFDKIRYKKLIVLK